MRHVQGSSPPAAPPRVLIVEDETDAAELLQLRLDALGYSVVGVAATGEEALGLVAHLEFDLCLMDISLPGAIDGVATAERLRELRDAPVVFLTSHSDRATFDRALSTSPLGFVTKPFDDEALQAAMSLALRRHRAERERRELDGRVARSQRLESLGVLAGGIAHDFNNLLTTILGNTQLCMLEVAEASPAAQSLEAVEQAALRAADLCRQLMAYAGHDTSPREALDLNALVRTTMSLIPTTQRHRADLRAQLDEVPPVLGSLPQLQQVVLNLVVNATESVGPRGVVTVRTAVDDLDEATLRAPEFVVEGAPGRYVRVEVDDDGEGIAPENVARIFEPFFSTRFKGRGLGLSAVLGIVRAHDGVVWLRSTPGRGTTFRVYLPAQPGLAPRVAESARDAEVDVGVPMLVVDDDELVRTMLERLLGRMGYAVTACGDGAAAVAALERGDVHYALMVVDYTMPGMNGIETIHAARARRPGLPAILVSGQGEQFLKEAVAAVPGVTFLRKPFQTSELQAEVRRTLAEATA